MFKTYAAAVIRNHLKKVMFSKKLSEYPPEDLSESPALSYELHSDMEYRELLSILKEETKTQNSSRALSYRILTDKLFHNQSMKAIADKYHLKKSAAYNRLQAARRDFYCSYVLC